MGYPHGHGRLKLRSTHRSRHRISDGVGRAAAVALAAAGPDVGITYHSYKEGAEQTAEEVRSHGRNALVAHLDTTELSAAGDVKQLPAVDGEQALQSASWNPRSGGRGRATPG